MVKFKIKDKKREKIKNKTIFNLTKIVLKNAYELIKQHKNFVIIFIIGIIFTIIFTTILSPMLATFFPTIDNDPPKIIEVTPLQNSNLFDLSNISIKVADDGGSGLDLANCFIKLGGAYSGEINCSRIIKNDLIICTPHEKLKPDVYTAEFFIKDKGGNVNKDFTKFTIFEKPIPRFDFYETPHAYSENDEVHGIKWKQRYIPYSFSIINEGSTVTLEDIELTFDFPGIILNHIIMAENSCINCCIKEAQSIPSIVYGGKTEKNFSTCQLVIDIERLPPGGIFAGLIFIDPQYMQKPDEVITFCGWRNRYYGHYFYEQLGWIHKVDVNGEIKMSPDAWINKGIFSRNKGIEYNFPPTLDIKDSLIAFDNAIKIDENSSSAWNEKGISLAYIGDFLGAIQSFNRSIGINPKFEKPYYHIALIYFKLGNCDIATSYAKKALDINPDSINASRLIELCENIEIVAPETIKKSLTELNEDEGTIVFTIGRSNLFDKSLEDIIIFDFPVGGSRFILKRDMDFNLVFEHISIQTGIRVAKVDISRFEECDKLFISLAWSKMNNTLYVGCSDGTNENLISQKAKQIDTENILIKNFLEIEQFIQIN